MERDTTQMRHKFCIEHADAHIDSNDAILVAIDSLVCTRGLGVGHTVLADSDRWGARKFTIRPPTAPGLFRLFQP